MKPIFTISLGWINHDRLRPLCGPESAITLADKKLAQSILEEK